MGGVTHAGSLNRMCDEGRGLVRRPGRLVVGEGGRDMGVSLLGGALFMYRLVGGSCLGALQGFCKEEPRTVSLARADCGRRVGRSSSE